MTTGFSRRSLLRAGVVGAAVTVLDALSGVGGPVFGGIRFRSVSELYNPRFDSLTPAAVAFCANLDNVARCVGFSRDHQIAPIPRAGGHS